MERGKLIKVYTDIKAQDHVLYSMCPSKNLPVLHLRVVTECVCVLLSVYEYEEVVERLADLSGDLPH